MRKNHKTRAVAFALCFAGLLTFASEHAWANRYYAPGLGRFISRDAVGYQRGNPRLTNGVFWVLNLYVYVDDRPTHFIDSSGWAEIDVAAIPSDYNSDREKENVRRGLDGHRGIVYPSVNFLINKLGDMTKSGDCLRTLEIGAHGSPRGINHIRADDASTIGRRIRDIVRLCCNCNIYLSGCNTGLGSGRMPQDLATATGCIVYGARGYLGGWHANRTVSVSRTYTRRDGTRAEPYDGSVDAAGDSSYRPFYPRALHRPQDCRQCPESGRDFPQSR